MSKPITGKLMSANVVNSTQILDLFNCIETTKVQTAMGNIRWSTESVLRNRLFLEYLGVTGK